MYDFRKGWHDANLLQNIGKGVRRTLAVMVAMVIGIGAAAVLLWAAHDKGGATKKVAAAQDTQAVASADDACALLAARAKIAFDKASPYYVHDTIPDVTERCFYDLKS